MLGDKDTEQNGNAGEVNFLPLTISAYVKKLHEVIGPHLCQGMQILS